MTLTSKEEETFWAKIYIAGDYEISKQVCREHCFNVGLCVTVERTDFIYTGGEESGVVVGLINYPRFPDTKDGIFDKAEALAMKLLEAAFQHSCLVMSQEKTKWFTSRNQDAGK